MVRGAHRARLRRSEDPGISRVKRATIRHGNVAETSQPAPGKEEQGPAPNASARLNLCASNTAPAPSGLLSSAIRLPAKTARLQMRSDRIERQHRIQFAQEPWH